MLSFGGGTKGSRRQRDRIGQLYPAVFQVLIGNNYYLGINQGVLEMGSLKKCPECNGEFHTCIKGVLVCKSCGYWTKENTVRLESMMLYEETVMLL